MIKVADLNLQCQQTEKIRKIFFEGNIEDRHRIAGLSIDTFEKVDITLDAGDQNTVSGIDQAKLVQRANAVGISVENVKMSHKRVPELNWIGKTPV